jgi:hypothetical protein
MKTAIACLDNRSRKGLQKCPQFCTSRRNLEIWIDEVCIYRQFVNRNGKSSCVREPVSKQKYQQQEELYYATNCVINHRNRSHHGNRRKRKRLRSVLLQF